MMNVITGLPRSGSTLLCNILNQNPDSFAASTSLLSGVVNSITTLISEQPESQNMDYEDIRLTTRETCGHWEQRHIKYKDKVIYDKGRLWSQMGLDYQNLKLGKMFVIVRDLRDVYASMEKQHRKNPLLHGSNVISSVDMYERAKIMCAPGGMIFSAVKGVEDLVRRNLSNVVFIQYEALCADPKKSLRAFDDFKYDFKKVENVATDNDKLYQGKYEHKGSGKVTTEYIGQWRDIIDIGLAKDIQSWFPFYNEQFGY